MSFVTLVEQAVDAGTPAAGRITIFARANDAFIVDDLGAVTSLTSVFDGDAIHDNVAAEISAIALKVTPASGDHVLIEDSAAADVKKRTTAQAIADLASGAPAVLTWSAFTLTTSTTDRYMSPGGGYDGTAHTTELQFRAPRAGTIQNLRARHTAAGVGAATLTYTIRDAGIATAVTFGMSNTVQDGSDLVNTVAVAAGALVSLELAKSAGITTSPTHCLITAEFV